MRKKKIKLKINMKMIKQYKMKSIRKQKYLIYIKKKKFNLLKNNNNNKIIKTLQQIKIIQDLYLEYKIL